MQIVSLVLASTSRFRLKLLADAGLSVTGEAPNCDESRIAGETPQETARLRAEAKALSLTSTKPGQLVIAADQVLDFEGHVYGKARDEAEAIARLKLFAGKTHRLHSAFALAVYNGSGAEQSPRLLTSRVVTATLTVRPLLDAEIIAYVKMGEWVGCAGGYQYEHRGGQLFSAVSGDISTIIGLPLLELFAELRRIGVNPLLQPTGPWSVPAPTAVPALPPTETGPT